MKGDFAIHYEISLCDKMLLIRITDCFPSYRTLTILSLLLWGVWAPLRATAKSTKSDQKLQKNAKITLQPNSNESARITTPVLIPPSTSTDHASSSSTIALLTKQLKLDALPFRLVETRGTLQPS